MAGMLFIGSFFLTEHLRRALLSRVGVLGADVAMVWACSQVCPSRAFCSPGQGSQTWSKKKLKLDAD